MKYPVCKLWLILVNKYNTTQPFSKFSKEYSLEYSKLRSYGANTFKRFDSAYIEQLCSILDCKFEDLIVDDEKAYHEWRAKRKHERKEMAEGVVYFVKNSEGLTKIGRTSQLKQRLQTLKYDKRGNGIELIHVIESKDTHVLESTLHKVFSDKRVEGEWFKLSDEDLNKLKR